MKTSIRLAAAATLAMSAAAIAAGPLQVTSSILTEQRVRAADGSTGVALVPANKVAPGSRVVFVLDYHNTGRQPIADLVLDNPVPPQIAFRGPFAGAQAPEVSVDGKAFGTLRTLSVRAADGTSRPAGQDDVTRVRWRLASPLAAGAKGRVAFQAVLR